MGTSWWRELQYGRSSQLLGDWLGQQALGTLLGALFSGLPVAFFYVADRLYPWFACRFRSRASLADPCGLPVLMFMLSVWRSP